jgi:phage-related protein
MWRKQREVQMKAYFKFGFYALFMIIFIAGCGCGGKKVPAAVTLVSIGVTPANPSIALGTNQQFKATGVFSDNSTQDLTEAVTWSSSDASVAPVSNTGGAAGLASSLAVGTTTVTATSGDVSGSTALTVTSAVLVSIEVTPANPSIVSGTNQQFKATGVFSDDSTQDLTETATWSSSDTSVAYAGNLEGSRGLAKSFKAGTTTITAASGGLQGSTTLTVKQAELVSITVTPVDPYARFGTKIQFVATGHYADSSTQDITALVTWSSSDTSVATISNADGSKGMATTDHVVGTTIITATYGDISGSTKLVDP